MSVLDHQPIRGLYAVGAVLTSLAFLPFQLVKNAIPAYRAHPQWSFQNAVVIWIIRRFLWHTANMRIRTPLSFEPGKLGARLEVIQPAAASQYQGVLSSKPDIKPIAIPGVWYPSVSSRAGPKEHPVILHIHGGCFVTLDARPGDSAFAAKTLALISPRVFMISYRLASNKGGIFPAALQDALTAYLHLVNLEGSARNIVLSGDSAGANIVLGLLRYIYSEEGRRLQIPKPKGALLWSPWLDIASVNKNPEIIDGHPNAVYDYMVSKMAGWGARSVGTIEDVKSPYLTSLGHPFALSETLLWYQAGDVEIWYEEAVKSSEEFKSIPGNKVELYVESGAVHDILVAGEVLGLEKHAERSALCAKEFLSSV